MLNTINDFFKKKYQFYERIFIRESPEIEGNPLEKASFIDYLFFFWIDPLLKKGQTNFLEKEMLYPVHDFYEANRLLQRFSIQWPTYKNKKNPLLRIFFCIFRKEIFILLILTIANSILVFTNPIIINRVIFFANLDEKPLKFAISLLICVFSSKFLAVLIETSMSFRSRSLGVNVISTLSMKIYEKCLKFSLLNSIDYNEGKLLNLIQTDLNVIGLLFQNLFSIIFSPIEVILGLLIMYVYIDMAFLAGLLVIILMSIINYFTGKIYIKYQENVMSCKDERSKAMNELLNGMKYIKINAQEEFFLEKIKVIRKKEIEFLTKRRSLDLVYIFIFWITPMLVTIFTFLVFILAKNQIDSIKVFTVVALFQTLSRSLVDFPYGFADLINSFISLKRIGKFLLQEEIDEKKILYEKNNNFDAVIMKNGTFFWENNKINDEGEKNEKNIIKETANCSIFSEPKIDDENIRIQSENDEIQKNNKILEETDQVSTQILKNLHLRIPKGSFVAIVGSVASGKTSLFSAFLNEMHQERSSTLSINGSLAYTSQKPWIQSLTIQENILFGAEFDSEKYNKIKEISCLEDDLKVMKYGDKTMLGDKGINLSGGQKARISLARALYADRDIYLFDDVLAAVDANIGKKIFQECFLTFLKKKTRVLITHALHYLEKVDYIYVMDHGEIIGEGKFEDLKNWEVLLEILKKFEEDKSFCEDEEKNKQNILNLNETSSNYNHEILKDANNINNSNLLEKMSLNSEVLSYDAIFDNLILEEERQYGHVTFSDVKAYVRYNGGFCFFFFVILLMLIWVFLELSSNFWLKYWIDSNDSSNNLFYLKIYVILAMAYAFCCTAKTGILFLGSYFCSSHLHTKIIKSLLFAPINEFFDRVPLGRVLNRLSKDLYNVDMELSFNIAVFLEVFFFLLGELGLFTYAISYWIILPLIFVVFFMKKVYSIYMKCNREFVRLEAISNSPIVSFFTETLGGLPIIRAFSQQSAFLAKHCLNVNENLRTLIIKYAFNEWFKQRIAFISLILVMTIIFFTLFLQFEASFAGLLIYYVFQIEGNIKEFYICLSGMECIMIAFERCFALTKIAPEVGYLTQEISKKKCFSLKVLKEKAESWPEFGVIEFREVDVKYRENLDFVLKNLSFSIKNNEKIGVVGRTGAGKSTLILCLTRILELDHGEIVIDGINIKNLDLRDLRKRITVIPQDPFFFEGTLKENLDPDQEFEEEFLLECLENVNLLQTFSN